MYFLLIGLLLTLLKYFEIGFVAGWSWWWVLAPYAAAALWWAWADTSGYTKRKAAEQIEKKRKDRLEKQRAALGTRGSRRR